MKKSKYITLKYLFSLVAVLLIFLMGFKYVNYRKGIFPYDTQQDYKYSFNALNTIQVSLEDGKITVPDSIVPDHSVFLKLKVKATLLGRFMQPRLKVASGDSVGIEYLEDGVAGYRYINISPLLNKESNIVSIEGTNVTIEDQLCDVYSFKNQNLKKSKILVIGTHPDDAEISAYGLYSSYPKTFVLTIMSGDTGKFKYDEVFNDTVAHYYKKGQLRTWNSITIPLLGGVQPENSLNFGYFSTLKKMYHSNPKNVAATFTKTFDINTYRKVNISPLKDSLVGSSNWNSLVKNLEIILSHVKPDVIVTPYAAIDKHYDHKYTTIALIEALKNLNIHNGYLYLYTNHLSFNSYYPFGKSGGLVSLPPNFKDSIYFSSIASINLDPAKQRDKLFALEANNDLRPDTEWRSGTKSIKNALKTAKTEMLNGSNSYFDIAVRRNELFFVVPIQQIYVKQDLGKIMGTVNL